MKCIIITIKQKFLPHKLQTVILLFACLSFSLQVTFAQNIDVIKSDIYSKLKCCACEVSFDKCSCPEAKEIKAYVDALLESSISKEDIFYRVAKKFTLNAILDLRIKQDVEKRLIKEAGEKQPQLILEPTFFDFGRVSKRKGKISKIFKLTNKGNDILTIKNIRSLCACVTASLKHSPYFGTAGVPSGWQEQIKPGETQDLDIVVDLNHVSVKVGKLVREVEITSNDPLYPEFVVNVEADVKD